MTPSVLDCEDWDLTYRILSDDGAPFDPTGSRFRAMVVATTGGAAVTTVSSDDGTLIVSGGPEPLVQIHSPLSTRGWRAGTRTPVMADVMRYTGPGDLVTSWFTRLEFVVEPATCSPGVAHGGMAVVLRPAQPGGIGTARAIRSGPQGPPGRDATVSPIAQVPAGEAIQAGQPVTLDRVTGRAMRATAAVYHRAYVAGFAGADAAPDSPVRVMGRLVTLSDWSDVVGTVDLPAGLPLFLDVTPGRLTPIAPSDPGMTTAPVGYAAGPHTLAISISTPILR